jgi:hypothetical protein
MEKKIIIKMSRIILPLSIGVLLFVNSIQFSQTKSKLPFQENEKVFIARKISKIQADHDEIVEIHKTWQMDSVEYIDRSILLQIYNSTGNHCFELHPPKKIQTIDIETLIYPIDSLPINDFTCYRSFMHPEKSYILAIDDSGSIFLLHNYWKDEFNRFIRKKIGTIDSFNKAFSVVKMYLDIELYNYYEGRKIIIDNGNIDRYKLIYSAMQAPQMKMENSNYIVSCFVISSCNTKVDQYEFTIMRDGQISFNKTIKYDSHTTY